MTITTMTSPAFIPPTPSSFHGQTLPCTAPQISTTQTMSMSLQAHSRRAFLHAALALPLIPLAAQAARSSMSGIYKEDAALVLTDMRTATELTRGAEGMSDTVGRTRTEMNDFVALYRRNGKVSGSTSFSTLYTAINTLSGHYASYGNTYPVPEKRKKRLTQQYSEIDRALNRGR